MTKYRITGKIDGIDYGVFEGETEEQAVRAMLDDAGADEEPKMENWIVEEEEEEEA